MLVGVELVVEHDLVAEGGFLWSAYVSSAGLVTLRLLNQSGSPITPAPATWKFTVFH